MNLYPYQEVGAAWLRTQSRALLADWAGGGKTAQALRALPKEARALVVCPKSALSVWLQECERWRPDLNVCCPGPPKASPEALWPQAREVCLVNYERLPDALPGRGAFNLGPDGLTLIADEAHALKSAKSLRSQRFRLFAKAVLAQGGACWMLTGSPLLNRPQELWALLAAGGMERAAFIDWPRFLAGFQVGSKVVKRTLVKDKAGQPVLDERGRQQWKDFSVLDWEHAEPTPWVRERLQRVMLRRTLADVELELPECRYRTLPVALGPDLWRELDTLLDRLEAAGIDTSAPDLLDALQRDQVLFREVARVRRLLALAKLPEALDLADEYEAQAEPLVVFSAHREPVEAFGRRPGWGVIHGDVDAAVRGHLVSEFQEGALQGLALTIQAGGTAVTLTRGAHALFVDEVWTPELNDQAVRRLLRIGQTRGVLVTRLVGDHVLEERVAAVTAKKSKLVEGVL